MKKYLLVALLLPLLLVACNDRKDDSSGATGSLQIASTVQGIDVSSASRASSDVNDFTLFLENVTNPEVLITGVFSEFPNGRIDDVPVGDYELTLTSHPEGFVKPTFNDPWYEGVEQNIPVVSGHTRIVKVECVQANAGVSFKYDPSLELIGMADIVPEMTQDGTTLRFEGDFREAKAYFLPKPVELRIKQGDKYLMIGGKESQTLDLGKEEWWETTLKASQITGAMAILATVKVINEPTKLISFGLSEADPVTLTPVEIAGYKASFLAKGTDITRMAYGLFLTADVDHALTGMSLEQFMEAYADEVPGSYLKALNSESGLLMNFSGLYPLEEYSLLLEPTQNNFSTVQRVDFKSADGIRPDPEQNPDGPVAPGTYALNIEVRDGQNAFIECFDNEIRLEKAVQDNLYIISDLYYLNWQLVARYDESAGGLLFTGETVEGDKAFNHTDFEIDGGAMYGGMFLTDGEKQVEELVFLVADRKIKKAATAMEFRFYDAWDDVLVESYLSPVDNPFTFVGHISGSWGDVVKQKRTCKFEPKGMRQAGTRAVRTGALRADVTTIR